MSDRIAVIEDEEALVEVLQHHLEREGYEVETFERGDEAWQAVREDPPSLILLDLMLPGLDGLELTRMLKRDERLRSVPVIMLTAKGAEVDRIVGFELGADDYIPKPFSPREVVLRVKAVLRRLQRPEADEGDQLRVGDVELDAEAHRVFVDGEEADLTHTEFRLLETLMERRGRVQTRSQLLSDVWEYADGVDSRTVDTHIRRLRGKLGDEASRIETVVGVGYRMSVD